MSGTYTIGAGGDYADFSAAVADLTSRSIDGPVVFDVLTGTYNDVLDLGSITGSSSANRITFRSQTGDAADVTLQNNSTSLGSFVVRFSGTDFVSVEDITLSSTASLQAVVQILTGSAGVELRRNSLTAVGEAIRALGQGIHDLVVEDNTIDANTGIRLEGQFSSSDLRRPVISGNEIHREGGAATGIDLTRADGAFVTANRIFSRSRAIRLIQCTGTDRRNLIANNMATATGVGAVALELFDTNAAVDVIHNSLSAFGVRNLQGLGLKVRASSSDVRLFNNSITNLGQNVALEVDDPSSISASDFNNIYSDWVGVARWSGFHRDLAALTAATGLDGNSISVLPNYISDTDLQTPSPYLDGAGIPRPEVTSDIDGDMRDGSAPDIGADEYASDPSATPLAGTLTVGAGGLYGTIQSAIDDLVLRGISGPVDLDILPGTYSEQLEIESITGADSLNRVTLRPQTGNPSDVTITSSTGGFRTTTILLNSADFITLENLTLASASTQANNPSVITFLDQSFGVTIRGCRIQNAGSAEAIFSDEQHPDRLIIENNEITGSTTAIFLHGLVFGPYVDRPTISGNLLTENRTALFLQHVDGFQATGNTIDAGIGFDLRATSGNAQRSRIANNFVHAAGVGGRGVWVRQSNSNIDVFHNSINTTDLNNTGNAALEVSNSSNTGVRVLNNSLVNSGRGRAYVVEDPMAVLESDHNNIWAAGPQLAIWDGGRNELGNLQTASGMDLNSISVYPDYASDTDLRTASPYLDGAATPVDEVTTDVDGEDRDATAPDIGADEYDADAAATPLSGMLTIGPGGTYPDFSTALQDLELRGVDGPTVFEILDGIYTEQVEIHDIPGADSTSTVTFRSQSGDSTAVTLTFAAATSAESFVVRFNSSDFVRLEHVTLQATGSQFNTVVDFLGKAEDVIVRRCQLVNRFSPIVFSRDHFPDRLTIEENRFSSTETFGGDAIRITGFTFGPFVAEPTIEGNQFPGASLGVGVVLTRVNGARIVRNRFNVRNGVIRLDASPGTLRRHLIANNFIHNTGNTSISIEITNGTTNVDVFHNSVNATTGFVTPLRIRAGAGSGHRVVNNIFRTENGNAYFVEAAALLTMSDHNNLISLNSSVASWDGTAYSTVADLAAASGMDANSVTIEPNFLSTVDLHTGNTDLQGLGVGVPEVVKDIDGEWRHPDTPDMGADEIEGFASRVGVEEEDDVAGSQLPNSFELGANYPNPFNPTTTIQYALPKPSSVTLIVFDLLGRKVRALEESKVPAGYHKVVLDASGLPSGVYLYRLRAGDFVETRSMVVLK